MDQVVLRKASAQPPVSGVAELVPQRWRATSFGSHGFLDGELAYPNHVAVGGGVIAVADSVNDRIQVFKLDGTFVRAITTADNVAFSNPIGVAINRKGDSMLISDTENNRVCLFAIDGSFQRSFGSAGTDQGRLQLPTGVAFAMLGEIVVADTGNNRIQVFNPRTGEFVRGFGEYGTGHGQLRQPFSIAIHQDYIYVADTYNHRVQAFNTEGRFMWTVGASGSGPTSFDMPTCITVDRQGRIYVADSGNNRVQVLSATGMFVQVVLPAEDDVGLDRPRGIVVDYETFDHVIVADSKRHRIVLLSPF